MLAGDPGSFAASSAGSGGASSGSGSGGTLVSGGSGSSGLVINVVFDASCANAPAGFEAGVESPSTSATAKLMVSRYLLAHSPKVKPS
jgi:hypothetical protein